jgi:hypothetical protein
LVARLTGGQEVAGSNPVTPIKEVDHGCIAVFHNATKDTAFAAVSFVVYEQNDK